MTQRSGAMVSAPQLEDFFTFCKKVNPKEFSQIIKEGQLVQCGPESIIFLQGELSDAFYVINDGMVEVVVSDDAGENSVVIASLYKGDLFGEVGLLTDSTHTASVRVPEAATLLRFDRVAFHKLLRSVPSFSQYLAMLLAYRVRQTTQQLYYYTNARELSGSLDFFDLPTIFQTIALSQQHGIMQIFNLAGEVLGEFAFAHGAPISGRYQTLYGLEALFQIFQMTPKAKFAFNRTHEPPIVESPLNITNVNEFTMHAIHLKDEMLVLEEKLKLSDETPLKRIHARLEWQEPEFEHVAKELWQTLMKEPLPLKILSEKLPYCRYHLIKVLDSLFETKQIAYAEMTPYGYR